MFKTRLDTFGNGFEQFSIFGNFLIFFENFRRIDPPWNTGQKIFLKKLPQIMFKTRLDTFGNDFEQFSNFENFLVFLKISKNRPSMEHWVKIFFRKNYPKTCSKHVWTLLGTILGIFRFLKNF